jgi:hypothetical protein
LSSKSTLNVEEIVMSRVIVDMGGAVHKLEEVNAEVVQRSVLHIDAGTGDVGVEVIDTPTTAREVDAVVPEQVYRGGTRFTQIYTMDAKAFNANHEYRIVTSSDGSVVAKINFQKGPVNEAGINGCHHEDLINIVIDRLESFQESEYKCRENAIALTKLEEALMWLDRRTSKRQQRGVEGTSVV